MIALNTIRCAAIKTDNGCNVTCNVNAFLLIFDVTRYANHTLNINLFNHNAWRIICNKIICNKCMEYYTCPRFIRITIINTDNRKVISQI